MMLQPGTRLGSYEITSRLGSGSMGQVYRAKDHKLGRDVAIKVLREELATDPERLRRFEQEARSASSLNHPNIVTIYGIGEYEATPYIAMEFVEGKTLRELLVEGPITTKKLLLFATQIAKQFAAIAFSRNFRFGRRRRQEALSGRWTMAMLGWLRLEDLRSKNGNTLLEASG